MIFTPAVPQQMFIEHLRRCPHALGYIGMGIGKSAAVLQHLTELFLAGDAVAALVVAPLRVCNITWPLEAKQWRQFQWLKIANLRTDSGQRAFLNGTAHIYLINYESIPLLVKLVQRRKDTIPYDVVVFDELTKSKNPSSKRINLYRRRVPRPPRVIGMTGTPMPNSHIDLFAQVRLVDDGQRLGTNFLEFKRQFFYGSESQFREWQPKAGTPEKLEQAIADITITLKSSDWLDIPDTVIEDIDIHFPPELQKQYEKLEKELVIELRKDKVMNVASAASLVTKLLQFTSGEIYDDEHNHHPIHNLKFDALKKIVAKEECPVFTAFMFRHEEKRLRENFPQAKFFNDAKNDTTQREMLNDWNKGKIPMLCGHPASVGHGLNLQYGGNVLAWISLTYSRELYEQLIARFSRRGQERIVKVYRLMVPGTVDDAVAEALSAKAANEARLISALQLLESFRNQKNV